MLQALVASTLLLTAADHWTTYLCLRTPVDGWVVSEANPLAEVLFAGVGLVPGLLIDSVVTLAAVAFLVTTRLVPQPAKAMLFFAATAWTGAAVVNNLRAVGAMGLSPWGIG